MTTNMATAPAGEGPEPTPGTGELQGPTGLSGAAGSGSTAAAPGAAQDPAMPAPTEPAGPVQPVPSVEKPLRILAVGDSITRATCWRALLWQSLQESFAGRFDMVGTLSEGNGCAPAGYDRDNQGYSSSLVTEIVAGVTTARTCDPTCPTLADLTAAFAQAQPDVVLMHFGTNDVWNARATEAIVGGYSQVVEAARAANPNVTILVAQIIPMNVTDATCSGCTCAGCATNVPALNARITSWATSTSTQSSAVRVVDQFTGFDATLDNRDGVHPNDLGARKMADRWYEALAPLF